MWDNTVTQRQIKGLAVIALAALVLWGCGGGTQQTIPTGRYVSDPPGEWIQVGPKRKIVFYVDIGRERPKLVTRKLKYTVERNGTVISPYATTSVDAAYGFGRFDWFLENGKIVKIEYETGKWLAVFSLEK